MKKNKHLKIYLKEREEELEDNRRLVVIVLSACVFWAGSLIMILEYVK